MIWIWLNSSVHESHPAQYSSLVNWFDSTSFWNWYDSTHVSTSIRFFKKWIDSSSDSSGYEKCVSIRFMIQAKIIWFWFASWFESESLTSLHVMHVNHFFRVVSNISVLNTRFFFSYIRGHRRSWAKGARGSHYEKSAVELACHARWPAPTARRGGWLATAGYLCPAAARCLSRSTSLAAPR